MKRSIKILMVVVSIVMVFAFASTAFASSDTNITQYVYGGASQPVEGSMYLIKDEPNSMDMHFNTIDWNNQSGLKFRGYTAYTTTACTILKSVYSEATYCATYTSSPSSVYAKISIASGDSNAWLYYWGSLYA